MDVIVAAIIGLVGTIIGGLLTTFGKDLFEKWSNEQSAHVDIIGLWNCEWYINDQTSKEKLYTSDTVEINKINGWEIEATGNHPTAKYILTGRISPVNVVTLIYEGKSKRLSPTGAVVLKVSPYADKMEGQWFGYTREDILKGGKVVWKRATK